MKRRTRKNFDEFPRPDIDKGAILEDTRKMDFLEKFRDWHVHTVFYYALLGMTEEQMAVGLDIPFHTFCSWKNKFPTFLEAIKKGKEQADSKVVFSLYQAALGYEHESEQLFVMKDKEYDPVTGKLIRETSRIVHEPIVKKYPPDTKAAIMWLQCRQPAQWSHKTEVSKTLNVNHQFDMKDLSLEDLQLLARIGQGRGRGLEGGMQTFQTTAQRELGSMQIEKLN